MGIWPPQACAHSSFTPFIISGYFGLRSARYLAVNARCHGACSALPQLACSDLDFAPGLPSRLVPIITVAEGAGRPELAANLSTDGCQSARRTTPSAAIVSGDWYMSLCHDSPGQRYLATDTVACAFVSFLSLASLHVWP